MTDCTHDWRLARSKQYVYTEHSYPTIEGKKTIFGNQKYSHRKEEWCIRIDEFYCTKCRGPITDIKEAPRWPEPDWLSKTIGAEWKEYRPNIPYQEAV